jgi:hypothetical protein
MTGALLPILPVSETRTVAAFSYAKKDQGSVRAALDRILGSTGDTQKYELSKLVLMRGDQLRRYVIDACRISDADLNRFRRPTYALLALFGPSGPPPEPCGFIRLPVVVIEYDWL